MAHGLLQRGSLGAVANEQSDADGGYLQIGHDVAAARQQRGGIEGLLGVRQPVGTGAIQQRDVILLRLLAQALIVLLPQCGHLVVVGEDRLGLTDGVQIAADGGVQQQGQSRQKHQDETGGKQPVFF